MYSSANQSKNLDKFSPSAIRRDMLKLQQQIRLLHSQIDQVSLSIPSDLPNNFPILMNQMKLLTNKVNAEIKFDFSQQTESLEKKINTLQEKLNEHEKDTNIQENQKDYYGSNSIYELEKEITASNNLFIEKLHTKIKQKIEDIDFQQKNRDDNLNEQKVVDLHLSANFTSVAENSEPQENQIIHIETTSTLDPWIHQRVQRHSDRICLVENDFDNLLTIKKEAKILPQKQFQQISSASKLNEQKIEDLERKYNEIESTSPDIKKQRQEKIEKKQKKKEELNPPGAVNYFEFTEFSNKIYNQFNDLSTEITGAENELNDSILDLDEHLNSIDFKINDFKKSASDFKFLIEMTDKNISETSLKIQKKNEVLSTFEKPTNELETITAKSEEKINQLSQEIKTKIDEIKEAILEFQADNRENSP